MLVAVTTYITYAVLRLYGVYHDSAYSAHIRHLTNTD